MAGLFAVTEQRLLDDESGRIDYRTGWLDAAFASEAFTQLREGARWRSERRQMYDREVDVPRLTGSYKLSDPALPAAVTRIHAQLREAVDAPFDSVGLNLYRDEHDSVAPHSDHLHEIAPGQPIALVSLGVPREMVIRAKQPPRRTLRIELEPGSLLVMSHATQLHYDHGIPKQRFALGARISLAFRVKTGAGRY